MWSGRSNGRSFEVSNFRFWPRARVQDTSRIADLESPLDYPTAAIGYLAGKRAVGHNLPVAVTSKVLLPGGIEWLVFGDQVERENFRTRL